MAYMKKSSWGLTVVSTYAFRNLSNGHGSDDRLLFSGLQEKT
jgi:hypothetical protein